MNREKRDAKYWVGVFITAIVICILVAIISGIIVWAMMQTARANSHRESVRGTVTYYHESGHDAATHHGDNQPTFVQGSWVLLKHHSYRYPVHITDVCDGSSCRMVDTSKDAFRRLHIPLSSGVGKVRALCGKHGNRPMRKCLVGEDQ